MYAWRFFEQFYEYTASGALVVAALITGLGVLLHGVLKRRLGGASLFFALLPCVALATTPNFRIVDLTVGLIASVGPFVIYQRLPKGAARRIYALLAMPALYLLAGGCFWLFAVWVVLTEWLEEKPSASLAWKLFLPALAAGLPVIAWRWLFLVPLRSAFLSPTVFASAWPRPVMLLYGYLALLPLWARVASRARAVSEERSKVGFVAGTGLLTLTAAALLWFCYRTGGERICGVSAAVQAEALGRHSPEGGGESIAEPDDAVLHELRARPQGKTPGRDVPLSADVRDARADPEFHGSQESGSGRRG